MSDEESLVHDSRPELLGITADRNSTYRVAVEHFGEHGPVGDLTQPDRLTTSDGPPPANGATR